MNLSFASLLTTHLKPRKIASVTLLATLLVSTAAHAVRSESVTHETYSDFREGKLTNVSLHRDGSLTLAPGTTEIASLAEAIIWSVAEAPDGSVYIGAGTEGRVYHLSLDGDLSELFATEEVLVRAMAVDSAGRLYVGTSPDGRVYRYSGDGDPEVFFEPRETYIWSLLFDDEDNLFVATGERGRVYRVNTGAEAGSGGDVFFDSEESHISVLAWDQQKRLLAGTSSNGYVYRVDREGNGFLLFNSPDEEVRLILPGDAGELFVGTFSSGSGNAGSGAISRAAALASDSGQGDEEESDTSSPSSASSNQRPGTIYRVDADGFYEPFWRLNDVSVHSLLNLDGGPLLIGTGGEGRIFSLSGFQSWKLRQTMPTGSEISAMIQRSGASDVLAFTSNPGRVFRLDFSLSSEGEFVSKVFDAQQVARWGRIYLDTVPGSQGVAAFVRSGNSEEADGSWTPWQEAAPDGASEVLPARYFQYRLTFADADAEVRRVRFFYRHANAAPVIQALKVVTGNLGLERFELPPQAPSVDLDQLLRNPRTESPQPPEPRQQIRAYERPGSVTIAWQARDRNNDELIYTVKLRRSGEEAWMTLRDKVRENFFSFNANGMPDGYYQAKVVASDRLSNAPGEAREARRESELFLIDNTAPEIHVEEVEVIGAGAYVRFKAMDKTSIIASAEYVLNGESPVMIFPEDGLFDAKQERFRLRLDDLEPGRHTLLIQVADEARNVRLHQLAIEVGGN